VVEVEGVVPGQGAVEPRLEIGRPAGLELVGSAPVVLAHPPNPRVHALHTGGSTMVSQSQGTDSIPECAG
jgi:hypothetical protein